jgi:alpha-mannosidase
LVFLPCHSLEDFPMWLDEADADAILASWIAGWHPAVIAAAGGRPEYASLDLSLPSETRVGIVPPLSDDLFAAHSSPDDNERLVRGVVGAEATVQAMAAVLGIAADSAEHLPGAAHAESFHALGLATLLAELIACRMRTSADLESTGFDAAVVAAAEAAVRGDDERVRQGLEEAFACLETSRARYYPVESWVIDLVLAAPGIPGTMLVEAIASPVPAAIIATGQTIRKLAERSPDAVAALREAIASGRVEACGGRDDERPLDLCAPESIVASFEAGRAAWQACLGIHPSCYASITGGASAIVPQVLAGFHSMAAVWSLFDGTPLPDPGGSRIRWESGGRSVEAIARGPLDASRSSTVLQLADTLGDAFDHDHTAVIQFACYAGTASRWHRLLRLIASRCSLLGTFVTPTGLVDRSTGAGIEASFEPDAFVPTPPPDGGDPVGEWAELIRSEAKRLAVAGEAIAERVGTLSATRSVASSGPPVRPPARRPEAKTGWLVRLTGRRRDDDARALDNGFVRLVAHPRTGGILSLRRPADRGNRVSQQLAVRSTAAVEGTVWSSPDERAIWTRMEADRIDREGGFAHGAILSQGRLVDGTGKQAGTFRQRMTLVPGMPLAMLEIDITLPQPLSGPLFESHVAARFAWHENEDVEIYRSLHLQSVATERTRFTAPHFIEVVPSLARTGPGSGGVMILTGGLPWHVRSSDHVLDCVLAGGGAATASIRLAVGIGIERPWDAAIAVAAGGMPGSPMTAPGNIRLGAGPPGLASERPGSLYVSLIESAGRAGDVRVEWGRPLARAVAVDLEGRPLPDVAVAVDGNATVVFLQRYQWLSLALEFEQSRGAP